MKLSTSKRLAAMTLAALTLVTGTAFASSTGWFHPDYVSYSTGALSISVGPDGFIAVTSGATAPCVNQTLDTIKVWQATAQAAVVSGKQIQLQYTGCSGGYYITNVAIGP
jgi:hypothetical protein